MRVFSLTDSVRFAHVVYHVQFASSRASFGAGIQPYDMARIYPSGNVRVSWDAGSLDCVLGIFCSACTYPRCTCAFSVAYILQDATPTRSAPLHKRQ